MAQTAQPRIVVERMRAAGFTEEIETCDCCGRTGLKGTVRMVIVSPDGDVLSEAGFFGVVCASKHSGLPVKAIRAQARAADEAARLARLDALADQYAAIRAGVVIPPATLLERRDNGRLEVWGNAALNIHIWCHHGYTEERQWCYESTYRDRVSAAQMTLPAGVEVYDLRANLNRRSAR